jgi:hypothetical protein
MIVCNRPYWLNAVKYQFLFFSNRFGKNIKQLGNGE